MKLFLFFLISTTIYSMPDNLEFIFLSSSASAYLEVNQEFKVATNNHECIRVEGGCFHPQLGVVPLEKYKNLKFKEFKTESKRAVNDFSGTVLQCDPSNHFSLFCGKNKKLSKDSEVEIWIDTSSSLKGIDYSNDNQHCFRRSFIETIRRDCGSKKITVSIYNTYKKELGTSDDLCISYGSNNSANLIKWIKSSKSKYLIVVTDVDEYSRELEAFLNTTGAQIRGIGVKPIYAKDISQFAASFGKLCK